MLYFQCHLRKLAGAVTLYRTTFIPEQFAVVGNFIKLKDNEKWVDGWEILSVGAGKEDEEIWRENKDHRKLKRKLGSCF